MGSMQTRIKQHRVGEVSSKYGYQPKRFDKDLEVRKLRADALWTEFNRWMIERSVTPDEARRLFVRLYEEYLG